MANPPEFRYGRGIAGKGAVIRWNSAAPAADTSWMIRYRFESAAALDRHLRFGEGGFFVPAPGLPGSGHPKRGHSSVGRARALQA